MAEVTKFLEKDALGIDIFALRRKSSGDTSEQSIAPLNRSQFTVKPGDSLTADVVITNKNIGHSFPPELRDFYEAYVEFTVKDQSGKAIYQSGFIKPDGFLDDKAHNYKTYLVKADGTYNDKHEIWQTRVIASNNQIPSGRSDMARYAFAVPQDAQGPLSLIARMRYRRFTRIFSNYVLGHSVDMPIVTMATTDYKLNIGENQPIAPVPGKGMPDWRRWNNYGIALLDLRQFALAADAFAHAGEMDEAYRPTAKVNRAMALIELDRYDDAFEILDAVVKENPDNWRALFQRTRILIRRSKLAEAETDLMRITEVFPRDRVSLQQLGELSKIKRDYKTARGIYERILQIDPEDNGSYYNLMLIYQKLGLRGRS
ncbi:MAG: tetratricopeptide repeat protein [Pyrinomonadaceae bacterium]